MDPRTVAPLGLPRAARIGVAAGLLGVDAQPIFDRIHFLVDTEIGILAWYPTDRVGLAAAAPLERTLALPSTLSEIARTLGSSAGPADTADVAERAMRGLHELAAPGDRFTLELGVDPEGPYATASIAGEATLAEDREMCRKLGVAADVCATLETQLARISRAERDQRRIEVTVHAGTAPATEVAIARPLRALRAAAPADEPLTTALEIAGALGASAAQLHLVPRIHKILARDNPVLARLVGRAAGATVTSAQVPRLVLEYADATIDTGLRVATGLGGDDAAVRFGKFTGAIDAERVLAIELMLGALDPMPARIACPVSARIGPLPS